MHAARALLIAVAGLAGLIGGTPRAAADVVSGTRGEVIERDHHVELVLDRGHARLTVQRSLFNAGEAFDEAVLEIAVPADGAAVGLRTLGTLHGEPRWFRGDLLDAGLARERYRELTGIGVADPKDPALLAWVTRDELQLRVFPIAPATDKMVEYTLVMPTHYEAGVHTLVLPGAEPAPESPLSPVKVRIVAARPGDALWVDGEPAEAGTQIELDADHVLGLVAPETPVLGGRVAVAGTSRRHVVRFAVEVGTQISTVPEDARIVVLLDLSVSHALSVDTATIAARAALTHFAGRGTPEVAIVGFDRKLHALTPGFVALEEAITRLDEPRVVARNGSRIDDALLHALHLLQSTHADAPRRVLLFTDALARETLEFSGLTAAIAASGATLHIAEIDARGVTALTRVDDGKWAAVAARSGGVQWRGSVRLDADNATVFEELARPLRIDHLRVRARSSGVELASDTSLAEGAALEQIELVRARTGGVIVDGLLWNRPIERRLDSSASEARLWSALALTSPNLPSLDARELAVLARRGRAVSEVTSYLAIEPGVRPSVIGLRESMTPAIRQAMTTLSGYGAPPPEFDLDRRAFLESKLRDALDECGCDRNGATAVLELTFAEIVDLRTLTLDPDHGDVAACVTEAIWSIELAPAFIDRRMTWTVEV